MTSNFPLSGIIGVVANSAEELDKAADHQLDCIELRADLLLDGGMSEDELLSLVKRSRALGLACLFTLRHPSHGGKFPGTEAERISINQRALAAGADMIDLEWDSEACETVARNFDWPVIVSYHDFDGMASATRLDEVTCRMHSLNPAAMKIVPTASNTNDAISMLQWVAGASADSGSLSAGPVKRIGFAMGEAGSFTRILTTAYGGALTYASFGEVVAPGQVGLEELLTLYRSGHLDARTAVVAVVGSQVTRSGSAQVSKSRVNDKVLELNRGFADQSLNQVAIGFPEDTAASIDALSAVLRVQQCVEV